MEVHPLLAIFVKEDITLVVLVLLEIYLKMLRLLRQKWFRLQNQIALTLKGLRRYEYLNHLKFSCRA